MINIHVNYEIISNEKNKNKQRNVYFINIIPANIQHRSKTN